MDVLPQTICSNCGILGDSSDGTLTYGTCEECTPPEILTISSNIKVLEANAEKVFDQIMKPSKSYYVQVNTSPLRKKLQEELDKHRNSGYRKSKLNENSSRA